MTAIVPIPSALLWVTLTVSVLGGCSASDAPAVPKGPVFSLNTGHWTPMPQDLVVPLPVAP